MMCDATACKEAVQWCGLVFIVACQQLHGNQWGPCDWSLGSRKKFPCWEKCEIIVKLSFGDT